MNGLVRITNDSAVSNLATLTIGDQIIPIYEATVHMKVGNLVTIEAILPTDRVDMVALERDTFVTVVKPKVKEDEAE